MKDYLKPEIAVTEFAVFEGFAEGGFGDESGDPGIVFDDDSVFVGEVEGYIVDKDAF